MKRAGFLGRPKPLDTSTSHEALKCLSNCILLQSSTKELIVERNGVEACFQLLSIPNLSMESQFLACRILFFLTVNNHELTGKLIHLDIAPVLQKVNTTPLLNASQCVAQSLLYYIRSFPIMSVN